MTGIFRDHGLKYAGRTAKIMERDDAIYSLDIDGGDWRWEEEMFDPDYRPEDEPLSAEDAIHAMMDDGETLYDGEGNPHSFYKERSRFELTDLGDRHNGVVAVFGDLYRHHPKRARRWTRWEILAWAGSEESRGWVVRHDGDTAWYLPQFFSYSSDVATFQRARLLPDGSGIDEDTIRGFEAEE